MALFYRIKYRWPSGKIRYRTKDRVTADPAEAIKLTMIEANDIVKNRSRDAYLVWGIIATKERV